MKRRSEQVKRTPELNEVLFPSRRATLSSCLQDWSVPETGPPAENLVSNEDSYTRVVGELSRLSRQGGTYLGVGPDQNFSLIVAARPGLSLIVDFRRRNALLHLVYKALFALARNRQEYLSRLMSRKIEDITNQSASPAALVEAFRLAKFDRRRLDEDIREVRRYLQPLNLVTDAEWGEIATIQAKLAGPGMEARFLGLPGYPTVGRMIGATDRSGKVAHFLATEKGYEAVRERQLEDRILPLVGDFAGTGAMKRIGDGLRDMSLDLSVVYMSDVEFFLIRAGKFDAYIENLATMPRADDAVIVRTSTRPIVHPERVQGDQCTTIVQDLARFLERAKAGRIRSADDLFQD